VLLRDAVHLMISTTSRNEMCHADIWAGVQPSAWREQLRVDPPNGRSWIYGASRPHLLVIECL